MNDVPAPVSGQGSNYSPVVVETKEAVGIVFLGLIALALLAALLRSQARVRQLLQQSSGR